MREVYNLISNCLKLLCWTDIFISNDQQVSFMSPTVGSVIHIVFPYMCTYSIYIPSFWWERNLEGCQSTFLFRDSKSRHYLERNFANIPAFIATWNNHSCFTNLIKICLLCVMSVTFLQRGFRWYWVKLSGGDVVVGGGGNDDNNNNNNNNVINGKLKTWEV